MSEFVRVKLLAYEAGTPTAIASGGPGLEYVAVKILEAIKTGTVTTVLSISFGLTKLFDFAHGECLAQSALPLVRS